jgi:putative SOS response-associated peptidase YedK
VKNFRCLVPANGFFEWYRGGIKKVLYFFSPKDGACIAMAGVYQPQQQSFAIITREANETVRPVHDRMPAVLEENGENKWLFGGELKAGEISLERRLVDYLTFGFCSGFNKT